MTYQGSALGISRTPRVSFCRNYLRHLRNLRMILH
jgi:hypothetical protein